MIKYNKNSAMVYCTLFALFLVSLLLTLPSVFAAREDFTYLAPAELSVCSCGQLSYLGTLINTGEVPSIYYFSLNGSAASWSQIVPDTMSLLDQASTIQTTVTSYITTNSTPNTTQFADPYCYYKSLESSVQTVVPVVQQVQEGSSSTQVSMFVSVPCGTTPGDYTLYTTVTSALGTSQVLPAVVHVSRCEVLRVEPVRVQNQLCTGDIGIYRFLLTNTGDYAETVSASVDSSFMQFNMPAYIIEPGKSVDAFLYAVDASKIENHMYNVTFEAQHSGYQYVVPILYSAINCTSPVVVQKSGFNIWPYILWFLILLLLLLLLLLPLLLLFAFFKALKRKIMQKRARNAAKPVRESKYVDDLALFDIGSKVSGEKKVYKVSEPARKLNWERLWLPFLLLLLLLAIILWSGIIYLLYTYVWPLLWGALLGLFGFVKLQFMGIAWGHVSNETNTNLTNITLNQTNTSAKDLLDLYWNITDPDVVNITTNATALNGSITWYSPVIGFFTGFTGICSIAVTIFLVLFLLSLFLLGMKVSESLPSPVYALLTFMKYAVPAVLFFFLILSFVYCTFSADCSTGQCGSISLTTNCTNATDINCTSEPIVRSSAVGNFCLSIFGPRLSTCSCLYTIAMLFCIGLIAVWLYAFIPLFIASRKHTASTKRERSRLSKRENGIDYSGRLTTAYVLFAMIVLFLGVIPTLVVMYHPVCATVVSPDPIDLDSLCKMENLTCANVTIPVNQTVINETIENETIVDSTPDCHPVTANIVCDVAVSKPTGNVIYFDGSKNNSNVSNDDFKLYYSWYLNRFSGYQKVIENITIPRVLRGNLSVDDLWVCEAHLTNGAQSYYVNSSPYLIVSECKNNSNVALDNVNTYLRYVYEMNKTAYFVMTEGSTEELNLSGYFADPDNDPLFYEIVRLTGDGVVTVDIWKGTATLKAKPGFIGIVNATVSAKDPSGDIAYGDLAIIVKPREWKGLFAENSSLSWENLRTPLLILLIIFVVIALLLALFGKKKDDEEEEMDFFKKF